MRILTKLVLCIALLTGVGMISVAFSSEPDAQWRKRAAVEDTTSAADISEEVRFGREVAARVIGRYGLYDEAPLTRYVQLVGSVIAGVTGRSELEYHFGILNTDEINAYAAPSSRCGMKQNSPVCSPMK